jgi:hypothetical protein
MIVKPGWDGYTAPELEALAINNACIALASLLKVGLIPKILPSAAWQ